MIRDPMTPAEHNPAPGGSPPDASPSDEDERLRILATHGPDELANDPELAAIVDFAARLCETPIALISLVERDRQRFLASAGITACETPRSTSFCAHAMIGSAPMIVPDATQDPRFADFALVTGEPHIRFYAGAPLVSREGVPLGSLCVIDTVPRIVGLSDLQRTGLQVLAAAVMQRLNARRLDLDSRAQSDASARRFAMLADNIPDIAWSCSAEGAFDFFNARWREYTGIDGPRAAEDWRPLVHPDDADAAFDAWYASAVSGNAFVTEFRMRHATGDWRWVLSRALPLRDDSGTIVRWFGTITEIDEVRRLSEQRDLLARELSHRIKNIFAVIGVLIALRARQVSDAGQLAEELGNTIRALGRANDYVRPLDGRKGRQMVGLLEELMAPYRSTGEGRVVIEGVDCPIGARAATPLALVFHELATNAAKYGALSNDSGTITLGITIDAPRGECHVRWRERGGPPVPQGERSEGFGSRLVKMSVEAQLNGRIERRWRPEGIEVELVIPRASLAD